MYVTVVTHVIRHPNEVDVRVSTAEQKEVLIVL